MRVYQIFRNLMIFMTIMSCIFFIRHQTSSYKVINSSKFMQKRLLQSNSSTTTTNTTTTTTTTTTTNETLTQQYCPGINFYNGSIVSSAVRQRSAQVFNSLKAMEFGSNKLDEMIKKSSDVNNLDFQDYGKQMVYIATPWIILLAITILTYITFCFIFCCEKCPCSKCCIKDTNKKPYPKWNRRCPNLFIWVFATGVIACGIAGYVVGKDLADGFSVFTCAVVSIIDEMINGNEKGTWIGLDPAINIVNALPNTLQSQMDDLLNVFQNTDWLTTDKQNLDSQNSNLYSNYKSLTLTSPNSATPSSTVNSYFIDYLLGPTTNQTTMTGSIQLDLDTKNGGLAVALNSMKSSAQQLRNDGNNIANNLKNSMGPINSLQKTVSNYENTLTKFAKLIKDNGKKYINIIFWCYWGIIILCIKQQQFFQNNSLITCLIIILGACFSLVGSVCGHCLGAYKCRGFMHFSWCFAGIFVIIGFLLSAVFAPVSVATLQFCQIYHQIFNDSISFTQTYKAIIPQNVTENLTICLFGNGDIASQFNFNQYLTQFNDLKSQFSKSDQITNSSAYETDTTIKYWKFRVNQLQLGQAQDSQAVTDDNSYVAIKNFNKYTDINAQNSLKSCSTAQDEWVFDLNNCTTSNKWASTNGASDQYGSKICIDINEFDNTKISTRYGSCDASAQSTISNRFQSLKSYDQSRNSQFGNVETDVGKLETSNDQFTAKVVNLQTSVNDKKQSLDNILKLGTFNCSFIKDDVDRIYDGICVGFLTPIYETMVLVIVGSIFLLIMFCCTFTSARQLARVAEGKSNSKNKQVYNQVGNQQWPPTAYSNKK